MHKWTALTIIKHFSSSSPILWRTSLFHAYQDSSNFREDQSLLHRTRNSGREWAWLTNSLVGQYLHQLSLVQSVPDPFRTGTVPWPKQIFLLQFLGRTSLCFTEHETQEEIELGGQIPCGSVLTPAISCTKFQFYLAHADSPMAWLKPNFFNF